MLLWYIEVQSNIISENKKSILKKYVYVLKLYN